MSGHLLTPEKYLSPLEVSRFRRVLKVEYEYAISHHYKTPIRDVAILQTILGAGLRVSEAANLKIGHLYFDQGQSELLIDCSKGGKSRIVKINKGLRTALKNFLKWKEQNGELLEKEDYAFLSCRKKPYTTRAIQMRFYIYRDKANLKKDCGIHALRHTFGLLLYKSSGHNLRLVQKQLGHASILTTQIYADVLDSDTEAAMEKIFNKEILAEA